MTAREVILHLSLIENLGPVAIGRILQHLPIAQVQQLYQMSYADIQQHFGFSESTAKKIYDGLANSTLLATELALIDKHAIGWLTFKDSSYPAQLKEIHAPPPVLYFKGSFDALSNTGLAIVGSRKANLYAKRVVTSLVPDFIQNNLSIISGGALGADAMAHEATVNAGGITVVVLGSGLLELYPKTNISLFKRVISTGGCLVSCFPIGMQALPGNFPARNRVISGLSQGCLVVQAAQKSGAVITASFALDQGRDVFAIPGPIDDPLSAGCHALIQQGAQLVNSADDVLQHFGLAQQKSVQKIEQKAVQLSVPIQENKPQTLEDELQVLCKRARSTDELMQETSCDLAQLQTVLFSMQLDGKIQQTFAGLWQAE